MSKARTGARCASEKQVPRCARNDRQKGKGKGKSKGKSKSKSKGKSKGKGEYRGLSTALRSGRDDRVDELGGGAEEEVGAGYGEE